MSFHSASVDLNNAMRSVREIWEEVRQGWDDPVSREFEEHTWEPLTAHVHQVLQAIDRLSPVLTRALRDCS